MISGLQIIQYDDGRFGLTIMEPGEPDAWYWEEFEERELQGGGYTWEGIVQSLIGLKMPEAAPHCDVGAEADNAYVDCQDRAILERLAGLLEEAINGRQLLIDAIDNAEDLE